MTIAILFPPGLKPVLKHGDHDQSSHGNWATGNFTDEDAMNLETTYSERYGIDKNDEPAGITRDEIDSLNAYSAAYYKTINGVLRGTMRAVTDSEAELLVQNDSKLYEEAISEYAESKDIQVEDLTDTQLEAAVTIYANNPENKDKIGITGSANLSEEQVVRAKEHMTNLDKLIAEAPPSFGDKNLYRVYSERVLEGLQEGDIVTDKGYLSTTRADITSKENLDTRGLLGDISATNDVVAVILPNESKNGKGLSVDGLKFAVESLATNLVTANNEREVLLPRSTPLKFLGYKKDVGEEARVAVFQRMDK